MAFSSVQQRWSAISLSELRRWLFPQRVYLQVGDEVIVMMAFESGQIQWLEKIPLPEGLCSSGYLNSPEAVGDLLGDIFVERGYAGARLKVVLPLTACQWRLLQFDSDQEVDPGVLVSDYAGAINFHGGINDLQLSLWSKIGPEGYRVIQAARAEAIQGWIDALALAGLSLDGVESAQSCLCRAVHRFIISEMPEFEDFQVIIHYGISDQVTIFVIRHGLPIYENTMSKIESMSGLAGIVEKLIQYLIAMQILSSDSHGLIAIDAVGVSDGETDKLRHELKLKTKLEVCNLRAEVDAFFGAQSEVTSRPTSLMIGLMLSEMT